MSKGKIVASIMVREISDMTRRGRRDICAWLRKQAQFIEDNPEAFSKEYRARYLCVNNSRIDIPAERKVKNGKA